MSRMKLVFAVLLLTAIVGVVPQAHAQAPIIKIIIAGSSAMWQSMALAAYKGNNTQGQCVSGGVAPCFHYTNSSFNLNDTRPKLKGAANAVVDTNAIWIVWDSHKNATTGADQPNVWAYIKVDSIVGDRCYFAHPHCNVNVGSFPAAGNLISSALWGDNSPDSTPPAIIQAKFVATTGPLVTAAATDIRPEDALFNSCRNNSAAGGGVDGTAGLGYNSNNPSGSCPVTNDLAHLVGQDILSGYPASTSTAHVVDFNLTGTDAFSGQTIPAYTTVSVGAAPIIFITNRQGALANVADATEAQLQQAFSGVKCTGNVFAGGGSGDIQVYLREPLSGTMNTTEYTVFRYPDFSGNSQETGVAGHNPLAGLACGTGGGRYHSIGTGEEVKFVKNSNTNFSTDGIGYTFFSYGNVSSIADSSNYAYLTLNGVDGIFHKRGSGIDPGQPAGGQLPGAADLPAGPCPSGFPCQENNIWSGHLSFPNLRSGAYRSWSVLRLVSDGAALGVAKLLATGAQVYAVNSVPDFVPALPVAANGASVPPTPADPGLRLLRSHYTQAGVAPINTSATGDKGGDEGGCILHAYPGTTAPAIAQSDTTTKLAQVLPGNECVVVP
jgi:hypothetical protein